LRSTTVLAGGDVSDALARANRGLADARRFVETRITFHGGTSASRARITQDLVATLQDNVNLALRMCGAKPIEVDVVGDDVTLSSLGYPNAASPSISGLYWDHPEWPSARIALREGRLAKERTLVFHELAHAVHSLAFTEPERALIYQVLQPSFGSRAAMDEVFAIYAEHEVGGAKVTFDEHDLAAPGIYGATRRQWSENHVFTRFMRKLFRPSAGVAGPKMPRGGDGWMRGLERRTPTKV
jgi:hypothetical protein